MLGIKKITTHFFFDIKLGYKFRRKFSLVADSNRDEPPGLATYSSVVSIDSVQISILIVDLKYLDIQAADIENTYLTATCIEKVWIIDGMKFVYNQGNYFNIVRAIYGLKSSGAIFRAYFNYDR